MNKECNKSIKKNSVSRSMTRLRNLAFDHCIMTDIFFCKDFCVWRIQQVNNSVNIKSSIETYSFFRFIFKLTVNIFPPFSVKKRKCLKLVGGDY